jgi:hypothetical protein
LECDTRVNTVSLFEGLGVRAVGPIHSSGIDDAALIHTPTAKLFQISAVLYRPAGAVGFMRGVGKLYRHLPPNAITEKRFNHSLFHTSVLALKQPSAFNLLHL